MGLTLNFLGDDSWISSHNVSNGRCIPLGRYYAFVLP